MGIPRHFADAIIHEHAFRPITGKVFLLGRQAMYFSPTEALSMMRAVGETPTETNPAKIAVDSHTVQGSGTGNISDSAFFRLLGVDTVSYIDISPYEGADVILDLNRQIGPEHEGIADVIIDGSTLDNLFDPPAVLRNLNRMLKPGGRILSYNVATNDGAPYSIITPLWVLDYFVLNRFADCKVYMTSRVPGGINVTTPDLSRLKPVPMPITNPVPGIESYVIFLAEKGTASTFDVIPTQHQYRSPDEWTAYAVGLDRLARSNRPHLLQSTAPGAIRGTDGYTFLAGPESSRPVPFPQRISRNRARKWRQRKWKQVRAWLKRTRLRLIKRGRRFARRWRKRIVLRAWRI